MSRPLSFAAPALERLSEALNGELAAPKARLELDRQSSRSARRQSGAYFTPQPLVDVVVDSILGWSTSNRSLRWRDDGSPELRVLDPAAGDGRFLAAAVDWLVAAAEGAGFAPNAARAAIEKRCIVAIERNPEFAERIRQRLPRATVHCSEALLAGKVDEGSIDVALGNPPYMRSIHLGQSDAELWTALRGTYSATSHGEWDLYAAFLEQGLRWLNAEGLLGFVLPTRWWSATWAGPLRELLGQRRAVAGLVDFGVQQVFADATTYCGVTFLSAGQNARVAVARQSSGRWQCDEVGAEEFSSSRPWSSSVTDKRRLMKRLAATTATLGQVARIAKGAGTNADRVFVFGERPAHIESELLRPVLRGRDVQPFGGVSTAGPVCLVPYSREGALLSPGQMRDSYPRGYGYLLEHRVALESRERGRFRGEAFYCYGRPQNLEFLGSKEPKIVVPDVAREGRALIDGKGAMVLDSAYALRPLAGSGVSLAMLLALMNSPIIRWWLLETGIGLRGGYLRLKTRYLETLPVPGDREAWQLAGAAASAPRVDPTEVEERMRGAYGLSSSEWDSAKSLE